MNVNALQEFHERLACEDILPLSWEPYLQPVGPASLIYLNENNLNVLHAVAAIEERLVEPLEEYGPLGQELMRLDAKLSLLLNVVGRQIVQSKELPRRVPIRFNAWGVSWEATDNVLVMGEEGVVSLHLHSFPAMPLLLAGRVVDTSVNDKGGTVTTVTFFDLAEPVKEVMERMIFRYHRRYVAGAHLAKSG